MRSADGQSAAALKNSAESRTVLRDERAFNPESVLYLRSFRVISLLIAHCLSIIRCRIVSFLTTQVHADVICG